MLTTGDKAVVPVSTGVVHLAAWLADRPDQPPVVVRGEIDPPGQARVPLAPATLNLIATGEQVLAVLGQVPGNGLAQTISEPTPLT